MTKIDRRAFMALTAVSFPMAAAPSTSMTENAYCQDPHHGWISERRRLLELWTACREEGPEEQALWDTADEIEKLILTTQPRTLDGIAAQLQFALDENLCGGEYGADFENLDRQMFEGMIAALRGEVVQ